MKSKPRLIHNIVIIGSFAATLGALLLRSYADLHQVMVGFLVIAMFFLTLAVVPLLIIEIIISAIAKAKHRSVSSNWVWVPGLIYIAFSAFAGWAMGTPKAEDQMGLSGLIPLMLYAYNGSLVLLAALISGLIGLFRAKSTK